MRWERHPHFCEKRRIWCWLRVALHQHRLWGWSHFSAPLLKTVDIVKQGRKVIRSNVTIQNTCVQSCEQRQKSGEYLRIGLLNHLKEHQEKCQVARFTDSQYLKSARRDAMQNAPQVASHLGALVQLLLVRSAAFPPDEFKAQRCTKETWRKAKRIRICRPK